MGGADPASWRPSTRAHRAWSSFARDAGRSVSGAGFRRASALVIEPGREFKLHFCGDALFCDTLLCRKIMRECVVGQVLREGAVFEHGRAARRADAAHATALSKQADAVVVDGCQHVTTQAVVAHEM